MDDVMVRSRYPRSNMAGKRRKRPGEKAGLSKIIMRQLLASIILLLIVVIIKSINAPATNYVSEKVRYVLTQNIKVETIYKYITDRIADLRGATAPDGNGLEQNQDSGQDTVPDNVNPVEDSSAGDAGKTDTAASGAGDTGNTTEKAGMNTAGAANNAGKTDTASAAAAGNTADITGADTAGAASSSSEANAAADADITAGIAQNIGSVSSSTSIPETSVLSASTETGTMPDQDMIPPINGVLSAPYGESMDAAGMLKMHEGIDIEAKGSESVKAAMDGTVTDTGSSPSYGNYIKIRHANGLESVYAHCSVINTARGAAVRQGDVIGKVSEVSASVGVHLHFEIWKDGKPVDPLKYISITEQ